ncbi:MAG TPA: TetR family transcriptional regulator [Myxococcota bacterium]|nr:TetR family transcriptional regulator [Myxococcota bacterium]
MARRNAKPVPRPQAERRALSARRLLDAATHLIAEQGFSRTTLAQIGEKAGYSRGLVNERFGSKGELVRVLADEFQTYFAHDQLEPALEEKHGLEALLITVDTYLDAVVSSGSLGRAYYELLAESIGLVPEIHATFVAADHALREGVERTVRSAVRAGEMPRDVDVKAFAVFVVGLLRGVVLQWLLAPADFDLKAVRVEIRRTLERAFAR